ncbi:BatD family protein [Gynuella sp.]|uniref:BatD family protein n=1 Tax=Gynuella sp. TaxID=2969146 RepID=UPI003D0B0DA9
MVRVILLITLLLSSIYSNAAVLATVSSDHIQEGQTLEFNLRTDQVNVDADFELLKVNFDILSSKQFTDSRIGLSTGIVRVTEWQLTLSPKATGVLRIPSIKVGQEKSDPIDVTVSPMTGQQKAELKKRMFIDVSVPKKEIYVDENLIISVKFYYQDNIQGAWGDVNVNNAIFEPYGNDSRRTVNTKGRTYQLVEQKYRLKVLAPGEFSLPVFSVSGEYSNNNSRRWTRFQVQSDPLTLTVQDIPASWPKNQKWLPASHVELTESWVGLKPELTVGDNVTRTIRLYVEGQDKSSQAVFQAPDVPQLKLYRDQPQLNETQASSGPTFSQTETWTLVPSDNGNVTLPATELYWWDVNQNQVHKETLPEHSFTIAGAVGSTTSQPIKPVLQDVPESDTGSAAVAPEQSSAISQPQGFNVWILTTLVFLLLWLATLYYLFRIRSFKKTTVSTGKNPKPRKFIKLLEQLCKEDKLPQVLQVLVAAINEHSGQNFTTIQQAMSCSDNPKFNELVEQMMQYRYSSRPDQSPECKKLPALLKQTAFRRATNHQQSYSDILYG